MLKVLLGAILCLGIMSNAHASGHKAEEDLPPVSNISYYELAPEIITNYSTPGNRIGYVRVKVQIMVDNPADLAIVETHAPMFRDIVITTLYSKDYVTISSAEGQDMINNECKSLMDAFLQEKEGRKLIREVLFTNFIYQ